MNVNLARTWVLAFAVVLTPNIASAFYAAHMGRWTSRDPFADRVGSSNSIIGLKNSMPSVHRDTFVDLANSQRPPSSQIAAPYIDGFNLYQYAQGSPAIGRDPTGLWTAADCQRAHDICMSGAYDSYEACIADGRRPIFCGVEFRARQAACAAAYAACMAGSEESLKCCVAVGAGAACAIAIIEPTPIGECVIVGVGIVVCTPKDEPNPHPHLR